MALTTAELIGSTAKYIQKYAASKGNQLKVYIDKTGSVSSFGEQTAQSLSISDDAYDFMSDAISQLNQKIKLDLSVTENIDDADIKVMKHGFDVSGKGSSSGYTSYKYSYAGNVDNPSEVNFKYIDVSVNTVYGDDDTNFWKHVFLHELFHALGGEHPFDISDGDGFGDESNPTVDETVLAYGPPSKGKYPESFTDIDIQALKEIWGNLNQEKDPSPEPSQSSSFKQLILSGSYSEINWKASTLDGLNESDYSDIDWGKVNLKHLQKNKNASIVWTWVEFDEFSPKQYKKIDWKKVDLNGFTKSNYDKIEWDKVDFKKMQKYQSTIEWNNVNFYSVFNSKSYKKIDWSDVNLIGFDKESLDSINWGKVKYAGQKSITDADGFDWKDVDFYQVFDSKAWKTISWNQVDFTGFQAQDYSKIQWGKVAYTGKKSITDSSTIEWKNVNFDQIFDSKAYKKINWAKVDFSSFDEADYDSIKWSKVKFHGKKQVGYDPNIWGNIDFSQIKSKKLKKIDWSLVDYSSLTPKQYSDIKWESVNLKYQNKKSVNYQAIDWNQLVQSDQFSAKVAKKVDWTKLEDGALDSDSLSLLTSMNVKQTVGVDFIVQKSTAGLGLPVSGKSLDFSSINPQVYGSGAVSEYGNLDITQSTLIFALDQQQLANSLGTF